jgi:cobalt-zinc-cadmium efflux system protein
VVHVHGHAADAGAETRRRLLVVLLVSAALMVLETIGGLVTGSLALLADAGHMLSDIGALGLAFFAAWIAARPSPPRATFGYQRVEILAAQVNAVSLVLVLFFVAREAISRLRQPAELDAAPVALLGALGLAANVVSARILRGDARENLNVRGAYLEVLSDLLASVGVLVAAALTHFFGWRRADPIISLGIAAFILPRIGFLLREITDVLMESTPRGIEIEAVRDAILAQAGVRAVHDLHVWAITPGRVCLSAHVVGAEGADRDGLILAINRSLRERFGMGHTTLQVEGADHPAFSGQASNESCDPCTSARPLAEPRKE